jgi:hypothetical protein
MTPLDLRLGPPRSPRAAIGGVTFLPRSIDKARAALPGGHLGDYTLEGITAVMLQKFGLDVAAFVAVVAAAPSEDDVAAFVRERVPPAGIDEWNVYMQRRRPRDGDRAAALELYPWLDERPDLLLSLDVLEEDDRRAFAR